MNKLLQPQEIAVLSLINKHFWKSKVGPLSAISFPIFLMILHFAIAQSASSEKSDIIFVSGLPSYLSFSILPLCMISLPQMIVEFKTSIILRKISTSRITATSFSFLILAYNFVAAILSTLLIFLFYAIFLNVDAPKQFANIKWGSLVLSLFAIYFSSLAFGLFLGVFINRNNMVPVLGFILLLISITFAGQFIPANVIFRAEAVRYMSLFSPMTYGLNQLNVALLDSNRDFLMKFIDNDLVEKNPVLKNQIEIVKNYDFKGLFDFSHDFKIFNFSLGLQNLAGDNSSSNETPSQLVIKKISEITVYKNWQVALNLIMPYIFGITFISLAIWKFRWTVR